MEAIYDKLENIKTLKARLEIAQELKHHREFDILYKRVMKWQDLIEELHNKDKYAMAYILNQFYYHNKSLKQIAEDLDYNYNYVSELKKKAIQYVIDEKLDAYIK